MSRNIKEIGKELMGKSLNSFHRKTGLTQLEENNKMQDGILDGILSQVDDAYIEKTEQSNVIHLDGSGDGVVVLDSIEGNTMVNLLKDLRADGAWVDNGNKFSLNIPTGSGQPMILGNLNYELKKDTVYTVILNVVEYTTGIPHVCFMNKENNKLASTTEATTSSLGLKKFKLTTKSDVDSSILRILPRNGIDNTYSIGKDILILEGDWSNREIPASYFEGLQSSFEEKVNDDGKYEIEILSKNKNIVNIKDAFTCVIGNWSTSTLNNHNPTSGTVNIGDNTLTVSGNTSYHYLAFPVDLKKGVTYYLNYNCNQPLGSAISFFTDLNTARIETKNAGNGTFVLKQDCKYIGFPLNNNIGSYTLSNLYININENYGYIEPKQNKIKLLINEPLRAIGDIKDKLCVRDGRLVVERNIEKFTLKDYDMTKWNYTHQNSTYCYCRTEDNSFISRVGARVGINAVTDMFPSDTGGNIFDKPVEGVFISSNKYFCIVLKREKANSKQEFLNWIDETNISVCYINEKSRYEEVLNEYGEPILLEGYENGTIYIDSTIVPTTTVRYTPKMESFKTLKEVENNNIMLTNDVNDNIIPYMMDVDLMIMEKEMALMSQYKIRRIGAKDMTSMQKRTQDMLTRLIKGKTLTEQECKTRVVTYLDAGKITDAQADELMLLISEVYA